jgi:hypothetical protein
MTLCPIALAAGCKKCPAFSVCPLKSVIGDQPKAAAATAPTPKTATGSSARRTHAAQRCDGSQPASVRRMKPFGSKRTPSRSSSLRCVRT